MGMKKGTRWKLLLELPDSDLKWSCFLYGRLVAAGLPIQTKQRGPNEQFYVAPRDFEDATEVKRKAWADYEELISASELAVARRRLAETLQSLDSLKQALPGSN